MHYPADRNRVPAHLTLFSQLPASIERELSARLAGYARYAPPGAQVSGVMDLGTGTAFRIESSELQDLREDLAETLHGLLGPQDRGPWNPHVTIQNKVEPRAAKRLQSELRARFRPRPLAIRGLALWRYLGGPWEAMRSYSFRG